MTSSVTLTVRLFGMTKGLAGDQASVTMTVNGDHRVRDLIALLDTRHPEIGELIKKKKILVSVNQEIAREDTLLGSDDEIALLPPFAGGAPMTESRHQAAVSDDEAMLVRVQREDFSLDAELNRIRRRSKRIGGIALFVGTARDRSKGRDVSGITFEHYEGMAQKKLREIRARALTDFDIIELLILHRYGPIEIGENIVLIIAGAEHRAEAFRACKWAIDELKQITPIWKREQTPEGEVWVEEHP